MRSRVWGWCVALAVLVARPAQAQEVEPTVRRADAPVKVIVSGAAPSVKLFVVDDDTDTVIHECRGRCFLMMRRGRYRLHTYDPATDTRRELDMFVRRRSHFVFEDGNDAARNGGLVLGIAGTLSVVTGLLMLVPLVLVRYPNEEEQTRGKVALGMMLGGAVATPIGWSIFASNRAHLRRHEAAKTASQARPSLRLGPSVLGPEAPGVLGALTF